MSLPHDGARPGRRRLLAAAGAALAAAVVGGARAQSGGWPSRPVSFVVPFPPAAAPTPLPGRSPPC